MTDDVRIVILTNGNFFATHLLTPTLQTHGKYIVGIFQVEGSYDGRGGIASKAELIRKMSPKYFLFKALIHVMYRYRLGGMKAVMPLRRCAMHWAPDALFTQIVNVKDASVQQAIKALEPTIIVSASCPQIIPSSLLRVAKIDAINVHGSLLPSYAGLAPYFWVLAEGLTQTGVTVHRMVSKVDAGPILAQQTVAIHDDDSVARTFWRICSQGGRLLQDVIESTIRSGPGPAMEPRSGISSSYRSHPNVRAMQCLKKNGHSLIKAKEVLDSGSWAVE